MSHEPVYLTFDLGTSALKTALVSASGCMLAVHTEEYTFLTPKPGWMEMSPDTYWQAVVSGTHEVLKQSGVGPSSVRAIGFSSQGQTFVPIDRSGKPLYNFIVWLDERGEWIANDWQWKWLSHEIFQITSGYPVVMPLLTVFKAAWFSHNEPRITLAWKYLCLPDYLIYRMTGETYTDYTIAQSTGMYDVRFENWEPILMEWAEVKLEQLPLVINPGEVAGKLTPEVAEELGLSPGIPVCVGANDQLCAAVGAGNCREGVVTETTGTALAVVVTTSELADPHGFMVGRHPVSDAYFAMPCASTSGIVLKWLRDLCCEGQHYEEFLAGVDEIPIGCDGLTALTDFSGNVGGAFTGVTLGHTRAHFARSIMESCCCVLKELLGLVGKFETVRSLGGSARSDTWLRMKADMLGMPVERPLCSDAASLGAAALAAWGTGAYGSVRKVSEEWYRPGKVFEPDPARFARYQDVYERYFNTRRQLYE